MTYYDLTENGDDYMLSDIATSLDYETFLLCVYLFVMGLMGAVV